jgi:hypothetical protein
MSATPRPPDLLEELSVGLLSGVLPNNHHHDPFWDLEGRGVRRRRRLRKLQAFLAWIALGAMLLLTLIGPPAFHVHALF